MIFDADALIWYTRGNENAARAVDSTDEPRISVVTQMELLRGARDKADLKRIKIILEELAFELLPLTENIGHRASLYVERHSLSTGLGVVDALVAATAAENNLTLVTGNTKHYRAIADLEIKAFRP